MKYDMKILSTKGCRHIFIGLNNCSLASTLALFVVKLMSTMNSWQWTLLPPDVHLSLFICVSVFNQCHFIFSEPLTVRAPASNYLVYLSFVGSSLLNGFLFNISAWVPTWAFSSLTFLMCTLVYYLATAKCITIVVSIVRSSENKYHNKFK